MIFRLAVYEGIINFKVVYTCGITFPGHEFSQETSRLVTLIAYYPFSDQFLVSLHMWSVTLRDIRFREK